MTKKKRTRKKDDSFMCVFYNRPLKYYPRIVLIMLSRNQMFAAS
jgi:hypothetical protein